MLFRSERSLRAIGGTISVGGIRSYVVGSARSKTVERGRERGAGGGVGCSYLYGGAGVECRVGGSTIYKTVCRDAATGRTK